MDEHASHVSPELARARLEAAAAAEIGTTRDRWIHGSAEVVFGLLWGGYFSYGVRSSGDLGPTEVALVISAVVVAGGIYLWQERADSAPRHSRRAHEVGFWTSLAIVVVLPFIPEPSVDQPWLDLLVAGLIAAPLVLAGLWILLRR